MPGRLVLGERLANPVERLLLAEDRPLQPGVGGHHEMAKRLGEAPLAVDGDVLDSSRGRQDLGPRLLDRDPSGAEAVRRGRSLELSAGEAAVELDLHPDDLRPADDSARQEAAGEPGAGEILIGELHVKIVAPRS
ncbi:MAG: hypothetical protein ACYDEN_11985, partial [Acidimicrobiales bacterium]